MPAVHIDSPSITFVHVPRAAGTSIGAWLVSGYPTAHHWVDHPTLDEIKQEHEVKFSFAVVRNPWDRVVSFYHHITHSAATGIPGKDYMQKVLLASNQGYFQNKVSFDQFVQDLHWLSIPKGIFRTDYPMASTQANYTQGIDLVFKQETLEQDFKAIQQMCNNYHPLPVLNTSEHEHYSTYYNSSTRATIEKLFAADIEQWQYQF